MEEFDNYKILMAKLAKTFTQDMHFIKDFKFEVVEFNEEEVVLKFLMQEKLHGNMLQGILHGGATATVLDTAGGMLAIAGTFAKQKHASIEEQLAKIAKAATIDLRIDYLRPGRGKYFLAKAKMVRCGNKIIVIDSYLYNDVDSLIARGIGTYLVDH
ncbi:MAG: hypothetical protein A3E87_02495 [Gammaproteobacteria bacterium RIFCSPHIGHO2_12_FULL_35_23]|nr:MAG: hypothetical protein A3E87_02495 [Gammaproteobacteria bacterium RIFCSPHIGHO2_12_FULL_35_23]